MKGNFDKLIDSEKPVLVDFYADWCGPCKAQAPILKEVAAALGDKARIIKIDIDKNKAISNRFKVMSVGTLMIFKDGQVLWRTSGISSKSDLISLLENNS